MHTKDKLADALREVGLDDMATAAATGYYHDYLSPLDLPEMALVTDLADRIKAAETPQDREAILALRSRVMDGDFDASIEESDAWAESPEGQETFSRLLNGRRI